MSSAWDKLKFSAFAALVLLLVLAYAYRRSELVRRGVDAGCGGSLGLLGRGAGASDNLAYRLTVGGLLNAAGQLVSTACLAIKAGAHTIPS